MHAPRGPGFQENADCFSLHPRPPPATPGCHPSSVNSSRFLLANSFLPSDTLASLYYSMVYHLVSSFICRNTGAHTLVLSIFRSTLYTVIPNYGTRVSIRLERHTYMHVSATSINIWTLYIW